MACQLSYQSLLTSLLFEFMRQLEQTFYPVDTRVSLTYTLLFQYWSSHTGQGACPCARQSSSVLYEYV